MKFRYHIFDGAHFRHIFLTFHGKRKFLNVRQSLHSTYIWLLLLFRIHFFSCVLPIFFSLRLLGAFEKIIWCANINSAQGKSSRLYFKPKNLYKTVNLPQNTFRVEWEGEKKTVPYCVRRIHRWKTMKLQNKFTYTHTCKRTLFM